MDRLAIVRIKCTLDHSEPARHATAKQAPMKLTLEQLEDRMAPAGWLCGPLDHCPGVRDRGDFNGILWRHENGTSF